MTSSDDNHYRQGAIAAQHSADAYLDELRAMSRSLDRLMKPYIEKALADKADRITFPRTVWDEARQIDPSLLALDSDGRLLGGRGKINDLPVHVEDQ